MYDVSDYARTYDVATTTSDIAETTYLMGIMDGLSVVSLIPTLAMFAFYIIIMWKIFTKAGKPGWASLIPVYNIVVLFQITGMSPWLLLLCLIPIVNIFVLLYIVVSLCGKLAKAFGKGTGYTVGLFFLTPIFMAILAFSDAEYQGV